MACLYCGKPVVLTPSAAERSRQTGLPVSYFIQLFPNHADCSVRHRSAEAVALMRRINGKNHV